MNSVLYNSSAKLPLSVSHCLAAHHLSTPSTEQSGGPLIEMMRNAPAGQHIVVGIIPVMKEIALALTGS